jgi:hypothetical protein
MMAMTKEDSLARARAWKKANPEKVKAHKKQWDENNQEHKSEYLKLWKEENKEKVDKHTKKFNSERPDYKWERALKRQYGLDLTAYYELLAQQGGKCAICGATPDQSTYGKLFVDHDHSTGEVRGLLCQKCNTALGMVNDDIDVLTSMISYLMVSGGVQ